MNAKMENAPGPGAIHFPRSARKTSCPLSFFGVLELPLLIIVLAERTTSLGNACVPNISPSLQHKTTSPASIGFPLRNFYFFPHTFTRKSYVRRWMSGHFPFITSILDFDVHVHNLRIGRNENKWKSDDTHQISHF